MKTSASALAPLPVLCAVLALAAGCATYQGGGERAQDDGDMPVLREDVDRCLSRLETMEIELRQIRQDIANLRSYGAQDEATRARLNEIDSRLAALDAARAADKQAIVDQLSGNVAKLMAGSSSGQPKPAGAAGGKGQEHIVRQGETLSSIAAAYRIKTSALAEANGITNPDSLRAGQKLAIPQLPK